MYKDKASYYKKYRIDRRHHSGMDVQSKKYG